MLALTASTSTFLGNSTFLANFLVLSLWCHVFVAPWAASSLPYPTSLSSARSFHLQLPASPPLFSVLARQLSFDLDFHLSNDLFEVLPSRPSSGMGFQGGLLGPNCCVIRLGSVCEGTSSEVKSDGRGLDEGIFLVWCFLFVFAFVVIGVDVGNDSVVG